MELVKLVDDRRDGRDQSLLLGPEKDAQGTGQTDAKVRGVTAGKCVIQYRQRVWSLNGECQDLSLARTKVRHQWEQGRIFWRLDTCPPK